MVGKYFGRKFCRSKRKSRSRPRLLELVNISFVIVVVDVLVRKVCRWLVVNFKCACTEKSACHARTKFSLFFKEKISFSIALCLDLKEESDNVTTLLQKLGLLKFNPRIFDRIINEIREIENRSKIEKVDQIEQKFTKINQSCSKSL